MPMARLWDVSSLLILDLTPILRHLCPLPTLFHKNNWLNLFKHKWLQWTVFWRQNKTSPRAARIENVRRGWEEVNKAHEGNWAADGLNQRSHWDEAQSQSLKTLGSYGCGRQRMYKLGISHVRGAPALCFTITAKGDPLRLPRGGLRGDWHRNEGVNAIMNHIMA